MRVLLIAATLLLSACGFHLRGSYVLPFDTLNISSTGSDALYLLLKNQIEIATKTKIVASDVPAQAKLEVLNDASEKRILSLSAAGRVSEYRLVRAFRFRVVDASGKELLTPDTILLTRDMTYDDARVLAKSEEENLLWRDIQSDLVQQVLRRLSAIKPTVAQAQP
jgi:LPS-assembly lipoprotein